MIELWARGGVGSKWIAYFKLSDITAVADGWDELTSTKWDGDTRRALAQRNERKYLQVRTMQPLAPPETQKVEHLKWDGKAILKPCRRLEDITNKSANDPMETKCVS